VGASGARPDTTIAAVATLDKLATSVTVKDAVNMPGVEYV
jgi:hypothetical protein